MCVCVSGNESPQWTLFAICHSTAINDFVKTIQKLALFTIFYWDVLTVIDNPFKDFSRSHNSSLEHIMWKYDYLPTYLPTYLATYLPTYLPTCLPAYLPTYLPTYHPTYLLTYQPTYLPTYLPTYQPIYLSIYLSIYLGQTTVH